MITERTLKGWRSDALLKLYELHGWDAPSENTKIIRQLCERILRLTQELIDHHLLRRKIG